MKRKELFFSFLILLAFAVFTLIVRAHLTDSMDFNVTVRTQNHLPIFFDPAFSLFSLIGSAEVISIFLLPLLFTYKWKSLPIFFSYGLGLFIEVIGKTFLDHPGPPHLFFRYDLDFNFPTAYIHTQHSYPSGHSYRTIFVIATWILILIYSAQTQTKKIIFTLLGLLFCVIMLFSRVTLGEHWTTDVIGGSLLGLGMAFGSFAVAHLSLAHRKSKK